jgi:hypothetical protein
MVTSKTKAHRKKPKKEKPFQAKFELSQSGRFIDHEYIDKLANDITTKKGCTRCDTEKLRYKGQEMTFTEFYE